jgi:hypothetical protein
MRKMKLSVTSHETINVIGDLEGPVKKFWLEKHARVPPPEQLKNIISKKVI